jgi:ABC-type amino acid transport substrate-binding protein
MAQRQFIEQGKHLSGFMTQDGRLIGQLTDAIVGHDALALRLGVTAAADSGKVIGFSLIKTPEGSIRVWGSGSFPPPTGYLDDAVANLIRALVQ